MSAAAYNVTIEAVPAAEQGVSTSLLYTAFGVTQAISTAVLGAVTATLPSRRPVRWSSPTPVTRSDSSCSSG